MPSEASLQETKKAVKKAAQQRKANDKADKAAYKKLLQEEAGNVSIEGFYTALDDAEIHAKESDRARDHLRIAFEIAAKLPPENRQDIEDRLEDALKSALRRAEDNTAAPYLADRASEDLLFAYEIADRLTPQKRQTIKDDLTRVFNAWNKAAIRDAGVKCFVTRDLYNAKKIKSKIKALEKGKRVGSRSFNFKIGSGYLTTPLSS